MNFFVPKKIDAENSWGEKLRLAREGRGLEIEEIAKKINIRSDYLKALEEERLDLLPAGLYGKNFLKEYAGFLGLEAKNLIEEHGEMATENISDPFSKKIVKKINSWFSRK
ncbi:MAG: helix-turn-helix domain-containing protein [Patescibacteria group bacterium]